ncbi:unnamed protein product [Arabidopsis halleri]
MIFVLLSRTIDLEDDDDEAKDGGREGSRRWSQILKIVSLLVESRVDINLRNYRGQLLYMQACQHGHWEVVLFLILFGANIHRSDYLNGSTALQLAALNGHPRCTRILLSEYIPSVPNCWSLLKNKKYSVAGFDPR